MNRIFLIILVQAAVAQMQKTPLIGPLKPTFFLTKSFVEVFISVYPNYMWNAITLCVCVFMCTNVLTSLKFH